MIIKFSTSDIIEIHDMIIEDFGGDYGVLSTSSIDFILEHAIENKYEEDFFTLLAKILRAITIDHPFVDGNKRTGLVMVEIILQDNDLILDVDENEKEKFILDVAKLKLSLDDIQVFLEKNSLEI